jgi:transcriptional regulator with XRE-family HTH domain
MPRKIKTAGGSELAAKIGRNVKLARTKMGITQSDLAEALDIESVTISRIETGVQLPSIDRLDEAAKVLKVSLATLIADRTKAGAYAEMLGDLMADMPARDREFLYGFAVNYAQHVRGAKKR